MIESTDSSTREALAQVLQTVDPFEKAELAATIAEGATNLFPDTPPSDWPRPAQRAEPPVLPPNEMPKRGLGSVAGRCALLHAVAHIELNAIDLAADMAGRFAHELPELKRGEFVADWVSVMGDEARHFVLINTRLSQLGSRYGALPAHAGLFDAATRTAGDWRARLAIAPLVLEARGLDVTPAMIEKFRRAGDSESADCLKVIYHDEIGHVAAGIRWFRYACQRDSLDPADTFKALVVQHFQGGLKRPFNDKARLEAGFEQQWYEALAR